MDRARAIGRRSTIYLAMALVVLVATPAWAAPGDVDTTFAGDGWAIQGVKEVWSNADLLIQADQKILVVSTTSSRMTAWRLLPDGELDPSFGANGVAVVPTERDSFAVAGALQPDGKILLGGVTGRRVIVARMNTDGALDDTFSSDGIASYRVDSQVFDGDMALLADGSIVAAAGNFDDSWLVRFDANGTRDATFGGTGSIVRTNRRIRSLVADGDGFLEIAASSTFRVFVSRYDAVGALDPSFAGDGRRRYELPSVDFPNDAIVDAQGRILISAAGLGSRRCFLTSGAVARLTPEGAVDATFSEDGVALRGCRAWRAVEIEADGDVIVGGIEWAGGGDGEYTLILARLDPAGAKDPTFGDEGTVAALPQDMPPIWTITDDVAIQADGKIVLVASGVWHAKLAVGRFLAN
jgi:uncharacterized delta-60 repeat protein